MRTRLAVLAALISAAVCLADTKIIQNDNFTGTGPVYSGVSLGEYQGAGVLFEPDPSDYPLTVIGVDVLAVGYMNAGASNGAFVISVWDEHAGTVAPPVPNDGGDFYRAVIDDDGIQLTASGTSFNRYTLAQPLLVPSGKVFVRVSEQTQTSLDSMTIALDTASSPKPGANWFFDGFGYFHPFEEGDGGYYNGLNRNWIVRLVLQVPDGAVTVTRITPNSSRTDETQQVAITGTNFELGAKAFLGTTELMVTSRTGVNLGATVPAGLPAGTYDVRVQNPLGQLGTLTAGYRVFDVDGGAPTGGGGGTTATGGGGGTTSETLTLTAVTPTMVYAEDTTALFITGTAFEAGVKLLIGGVNIESPVVESSGVISATLAPGRLTPGTYDVAVINLSGQSATLPNAFTVVAGTRASAGKGCGCTSVEVFPLVLIGLAALRRRAGRKSR